jgi:alkaline phosphatase
MEKRSAFVRTSRLFALLLISLVPIIANAQSVKIVLPERFRVLSGQLFDLRVEVAGITSLDADIQVVVNDGNKHDALQGASGPEVTTNNDNNAAALDKAWTWRSLSFGRPGVRTLKVVITDGDNSYEAATQIGVQEFKLQGQKSIILFIGDAMGTAYRDAGRIVAQSTGHRFREGFFDELQQMDQMPVTGMVMTYALDNITPDSANTGTAWTTGNKTINGTLNVFPDNTDFKYNGASTATQQATKQWALDNPRIETLWEYLKRLYGYKTGIVTTSEVTDATPAAEGGHTLARALQNDIARQFVDGVFTAGPTFDVIMGGAKERFDSRTVANSGDTRNLVTELQAAGFTYVQNRAQLNALPGGNSGPNRVLGLFRTGNMNVAYDKLGLVRPSDEPAPSFGGFTNQPFLDEMTDKAIAALSKGGGPFILMVEGASIDKQSHPNHSNGQIWDTIEFDKAVGVGRSFMNGNDRKDSTLLLVTADHDQSMVITGLIDTSVPGAIQNARSNSPYPASAPPPPAGAGGVNPGESDGFPDYEDANGDRYPENLNRFKIGVGYRTGNHTGSSVPITAEGAGALLFLGYYDQTDVFFKMAKALSTNTKQLDQALDQKLKEDLPAFDPPATLRSGPHSKSILERP